MEKVIKGDFQINIKKNGEATMRFDDGSEYHGHAEFMTEEKPGVLFDFAPGEEEKLKPEHIEVLTEVGYYDLKEAD